MNTGDLFAGQTFNLIFTPNFGQGDKIYKLSDSNPGQFYYNVFYTWDADDTGAKTFVIDVPDEFVTQAANPLHVYSGVGIGSGADGFTCFDEGEHIFRPIMEEGVFGDGKVKIFNQILH